MSTSSSSAATLDPPLAAPPPRATAPAAAPSAAALVARLARRRRIAPPWGAVWAAGIVVAVHLLSALIVYPDPMAGPNQRRKFLAIPPGTTPTVLVAGDSRTECGVLPRALAEAAGLDPDSTFNVAIPAGEPAALAAAVREWDDRLADGAIVVLGVSLIAVNDGAHESYIGDETLWSLNVADRLKLVAPRRALLATFFPEREALRRHVLEPLFQHWDLTRARQEQGYRGKAKAKPLSAEDVRSRASELQDKWIGRPNLAGERMNLLRQTLAELRARGYQPVLVDLPEHPLLPEAVAGTPVASVLGEFRQALSETAAAAGVPVLAYSAEQLGPQAGDCFVSLMHLDRRGAERLTALLGADLRSLLGDGRLQQPRPAAARPPKG